MVRIFPYDSAGNPLLWNDFVLEWERGRQLKQFGSTSFTYDAGGVRQSKTANGVTTSYFTEGNRIHREDRSDGKTLLYAYDASGLASITYNGTLYYVQKNFQGDIVALVDRDGTVVAKYVYDAWGNGKVCNASGTLNTSDSFIGNINPFRYRATTTTWRRACTICRRAITTRRRAGSSMPTAWTISRQTSSAALNLYAYCNNNPVMYSDPEGTLVGFIVLIGLAVTALAGGIIKGIQSTQEGNAPLEVFKDVMIGIGAGLTVGGLVFASAGVIVTAVSTAVSAGAALFSLGAAGANIGLFLVSAFTGKETPGPIEPPKIPDVIPTSPTILDYRTSSRKFENSKNFLYDHFVSILI